MRDSREDPVMMALSAHLNAEDEFMSKCPRCDRCKDPITGDDYWEVDGQRYCEDCMNDTFYISLDDDGETCDYCGGDFEDYSAYKVGSDNICRDCFNEEFRKDVYRYIMGRR